MTTNERSLKNKAKLIYLKLCFKMGLKHWDPSQIVELAEISLHANSEEQTHTTFLFDLLNFARQPL